MLIELGWLGRHSTKTEAWTHGFHAPKVVHYEQERSPLFLLGGIGQINAADAVQRRGAAASALVPANALIIKRRLKWVISAFLWLLLTTTARNDKSSHYHFSMNGHIKYRYTQSAVQLIYCNPILAFASIIYYQICPCLIMTKINITW